MPVLARTVSDLNVRSASSQGETMVAFDSESRVTRAPADNPLDAVRRPIWHQPLARSVELAEVAMDFGTGAPATTVKLRSVSVWCCHSFFAPNSADHVLLKNHVASPRQMTNCA